MAGVDPEAFVDGDKYRPCENMGPGRYGPVVFRAHNDQNGRGEKKEWGKHKKLQAMRWGLIPSFNKPTIKPDHFIMFNARSESLQERPAFRRLLETKRCVILSEGYYEWQQVDKREKQPYYIYRTTGPLKFAGLYDSWVNEEGDKSFTYTILTTEIPPQLSWMHTRIPVILSDDGATRWLSDTKFENLRDLLVGYCGDDLKWYPVDKRVGSTNFQSEDCSKKVDIKHAANITSFFGSPDKEQPITAPSPPKAPKTEVFPASEPESKKTSQSEPTSSSQGDTTKLSQDVLPKPISSSPVRLKPDRREEFRSPIKFLFQQQQMVQQAEEIMRGGPAEAASPSMGTKRALSPNHPRPSPKKPRKAKPSPKKPATQRGTLLAYFQPKS